MKKPINYIIGYRIIDGEIIDVQTSSDWGGNITVTVSTETGIAFKSTVVSPSNEIYKQYLHYKKGQHIKVMELATGRIELERIPLRYDIENSKFIRLTENYELYEKNIKLNDNDVILKTQADGSEFIKKFEKLSLLEDRRDWINHYCGIILALFCLCFFPLFPILIKSMLFKTIFSLLIYFIFYINITAIQYKRKFDFRWIFNSTLESDYIINLKNAETNKYDKSIS